MTASGALASERTTLSRTVGWLQALIAIGLAVAAWHGAEALWALDASAGPAAQTINIRWSPALSAEDRLRVEGDLGLIAAKDVRLDARTTGIYRLARRSSRDIGRILSHPMVLDTYHIDRTGLRVALDQPEMNGWLRRLLETDQVPLVGWLIVTGGVAALWAARRGLRRVAADLWHALTSALRWSTAAADAHRAVQARAAESADGRVAGSSRAEIVWAVALGAAFLLPLLLYGQWDDEEAGLGVFSSQIHYRALFHGQWLFWLDSLGFGTPMPIGQRLDFHPAFAIGNLISLRAALAAFWVTQVALMVVYFQRLTVVSGIRRPLRTILLACYLVSAPSLCYFYGSDWQSVILGWSLYPALIFYLRQLVRGEAQSHFWTASLRLAVVASVWVLNSHPGYLAPLACVLGIYAIALVPRARAFAALAVTGAIVAAVSAERIYFAVSESQMFPPGLIRLMQSGFSPYHYLSAALVPVTALNGNLRLPFIGLVFGVLAVAAVPIVLKRGDPHARACGVAFASAALLSMAPDGLFLPLRVFSGIWLFRDPMVVFGLLAGGRLLQRALEAASGRLALGVRALLGLQIAQQGLLLWVSLGGVFAHPNGALAYQYQGERFRLAGVLADRARMFGPRLYVSEELRTHLRGYLWAHGIHVITDLTFVDVSPINVWFKGVAMDRLSPSFALMHGIIMGQPDVIENRALLDVLGVGLVMVTEAEGPVPQRLQLLDRYSASGWRVLLLFGNPTAWPKAVLTSIEARDLHLPKRPACPNEGALCRDYERLAAMRLPDPVEYTGRDGSYTARFAPSDRERLLFVSSMYRPEFTARSMGRPLRIDPVANAFLGITIPAGASEVAIAFTPTARIALAWVSGISLVTLLIVFSTIWWRNRSVGWTEPAPRTAW